MTLAAWLYYERDLDQSAVARRMGLSRSQVSRLLTGARSEGIVEVRIHGELPSTWRLGHQVAEQLGLESVHVGMADDGEDSRNVAARTAARVLDDAVRRPISLGLGWGRTLGLIARHARQQATAGVELVDIVGRPVWPIKDPPFEVSAALARVYEASVSHVPAPAIVESLEIAEALRRDPLVSGVLDRAAGAGLTVIAIGNADPSTSSLVLSGAVPAATVAALREQGAVAEIVGHFFDSSGNLIPSELEQRIVGLGLDQLARSADVVAVAAGDDKVAPIRAAARGGLIRRLVTDARTAQALATPD